MNELMNVESRNTLTSLDIAEITGKEHKNILSDIRDEISKIGEERGRLIFQPTTYIDNFNRNQPAFLLNYKGVLQLGARYNAETRFKLIEKIEQLQKPMTVEDMIILQANEMKSVKHRIDIVENKVDNEIRIDHTEQRKLQKAVSIRVYQRLDVVDAERKLMFSAIYRDLKNTPIITSDDRYIRGNDYTTIGFLYKYENNAKPRYAADLEKKEKENNREAEIDTTENQIKSTNMVRNSNTQEFSINNANKNSIDKILVNSDDRLFLSSEEEEAYKSYVEEENYRQNKFSLNDFNAKLQNLRSHKKYFQIGMDMQIDGSDAANPSGMKGFDRINDLTFKVEAGYLEKMFVRYAFIMERPDRIYRNNATRNSTFDFRKHEFEGKYMFSNDPDKPWWVGGKIQYVQNGASKASDPEIYESSWYARKVNKITLGMATLTHRFENVEWEIGAGMKWDKPNNKKLGYYPVVSLKFGVTPFPEKNAQFNYSGKGFEFGAGL